MLKLMWAPDGVPSEIEWRLSHSWNYFSFSGPALAIGTCERSRGKIGGIDNGHNNSPGASAVRRAVLMLYR